MAYFDSPGDDALPILSGAGSGAMVGSAFGPVGTGVGAGIGALGGLFQSVSNSRARDAQKKAQEQLMQAARMQYQQRMQDLSRAMQYFQPANARIQRLYGTGAAPPPFTPPTSYGGR